ncbi:hypothetical protein PR048_024185 [Dryococelus australis]|uniref:Uncharacterized protein n=1 Tax=Dryococelus australis TaxID=614101 RepID=A0ABQ9GW57_9NEOP|nr:hypothetical protein PR048_024185 [Dryococelus australis]
MCAFLITYCVCLPANHGHSVSELPNSDCPSQVRNCLLIKTPGTHDAQADRCSVEPTCSVLRDARTSCRQPILSGIASPAVLPSISCIVYSRLLSTVLKSYLRLLASHLVGLLPRVGVVSDDATGRWVFSGICRFLPPLHSGAAPQSPQSPSSALTISLLKAARISSLTHSLEDVPTRHVHNDLELHNKNFLLTFPPLSSEKGDTATSLKWAVASTCKALKWRAVYASLLQAETLGVSSEICALFIDQHIVGYSSVKRKTLDFKLTVIQFKSAKYARISSFEPFVCSSLASMRRMVVSPPEVGFKPESDGGIGPTQINSNFKPVHIEVKGPPGLSCGLETIKLALNRMRVERGEYGAAPECKGGGNWIPIPDKNPPTSSILRQRPRRESNPGSPWWEASSLTTTPPRGIGKTAEGENCAPVQSRARSGDGAFVGLTQLQVDGDLNNELATVSPHKHISPARSLSRLLVPALRRVMQEGTNQQRNKTEEDMPNVRYLNAVTPNYTGPISELAPPYPLPKFLHTEPESSCIIYLRRAVFTCVVLYLLASCCRGCEFWTDHASYWLLQMLRSVGAVVSWSPCYCQSDIRSVSRFPYVGCEDGPIVHCAGVENTRECGEYICLCSCYFVETTENVVHESEGRGGRSLGKLRPIGTHALKRTVTVLQPSQIKAVQEPRAEVNTWYKIGWTQRLYHSGGGEDYSLFQFGSAASLRSTTVVPVGGEGTLFSEPLRNCGNKDIRWLRVCAIHQDHVCVFLKRVLDHVNQKHDGPVSEELWATLDIEVFRADEGEASTFNLQLNLMQQVQEFPPNPAIFITLLVYFEAANRSAAEKRSRWKLLMKTVHFEGETTAIGTRSKPRPLSDCTKPFRQCKLAAARACWRTCDVVRMRGGKFQTGEQRICGVKDTHVARSRCETCHDSLFSRQLRYVARLLSPSANTVSPFQIIKILATMGAQLPNLNCTMIDGGLYFNNSIEPERSDGGLYFNNSIEPERSDGGLYLNNSIEPARSDGGLYFNNSIEPERSDGGLYLNNSIEPERSDGGLYFNNSIEPERSDGGLYFNNSIEPERSDGGLYFNNSIEPERSDGGLYFNNSIEPERSDGGLYFNDSSYRSGSLCKYLLFQAEERDKGDYDSRVYRSFYIKVLKWRSVFLICSCNYYAGIT